jgi:hypothetical protein
MTKKWTESGIYEGQDYQFDKDFLYQLTTELSSRGIKKIPVEFFSDLSTEIGVYLGVRKMREDCKPAKIRGRLGSALKLATKLSEEIANMDWNTRDLIDNVRDADHKIIKNQLQTIVSTLKEARQEAEAYPKRGALPDNTKTLLAKSVAEAIQKHLHITGTSTKGGILESILIIVRSNVHGKEVSSVDDLYRRISKVYTFRPTNTIETMEQKDD